eukprot:10631097-Karenia_brevis.AAC.1
MVAHALDGDFKAALQQVTWMPAHSATNSIGRSKDSKGMPITALMWRANRLVDVLAKAAASPSRLPAWATTRVQAAAKFVQYNAARLGVATNRANNCAVAVVTDDGTTTQRYMRDSTADRPRWQSQQRQGCKR